MGHERRFRGIREESVHPLKLTVGTDILIGSDVPTSVSGSCCFCCKRRDEPACDRVLKRFPQNYYEPFIGIYMNEVPRIAQPCAPSYREVHIQDGGL